jgi:hypothetical protein
MFIVGHLMFGCTVMVSKHYAIEQIVGEWSLVISYSLWSLSASDSLQPLHYFLCACSQQNILS